ncbi:MAG: epoxyqueuosine reductase [Deltaproteobacteria bacterium]
MKMDSLSTKRMAVELGADLVGIASAEDFDVAPEGFHPTDVLPTCKSVMVFACEFPRSSLDADPVTYTQIRNQMTQKMNKLASAMVKKLKSLGVDAVPIKAITSQWNNGRNRGAISLKHAAVIAGLGRLGKNTLLINNTFGNMIWLSAVVTSVVLAPDPVAEYEACLPGCQLCIESCPVGALGDEFMQQRKCANFAFQRREGQLQIQCWECRKVCPNCLGL